MPDAGRRTDPTAAWFVSPAVVLCWLVLAVVVSFADDYADLFRQAATDTQQGHYQGAIQKYQAALAIRPGAAEALNNLAVLYYQVHQYSDAFHIASQIWQSHKELKSSALITGLAAVQCNRPKDAIAPFEMLLSVDPANRDALLGLASAHFALNELPEAVEVYRREIKISPQDSNAWYGLAICYERMAENASKKLSQMPGGSGYSKRLLAEYLQSAGDTKLAAEAFGDPEANASAASPEAERQYQLARDLADQSRNAFSHFVNLAPDSWQTAVFLGDVERQHGNLVAAISHYGKAAEAQPNNPAPLLGLGTVYWEMGDFDHATSYLREVLHLNPRAPQAIFELANIAVRQRQENEAIPLLEKYLAAQPDALAARADLGRAYIHLGQYQKAVVELTKAGETDERGDIHYQLSIALRKLGRTQEADAALKRSTEIRQSQLRREQRLHTNR
ncbi:MAG: tetratricopeptide repeat protein [Acidobacteriaceae bacterium]|nr:tetratricopeptide repeat protein [Acidobacteriaceae bacterium]